MAREPNSEADDPLDVEAEKLVEAALNGDKDALMEVIASFEHEDEDEMVEDTPSPSVDRTATLKVYRYADQSVEHSFADAALNPATRAALTVHSLSRGRFVDQGLSLNALVDVLNDQVRKVNDKDLDRGEAMLTAQAHTLDAIYNDLVRRALLQEHAPHMEMFFKVALRAQSQCRATWEAISAIQNPPIAGYVGQANIANNQQINNGLPLTRASEKQNPPNKLLEQTTHEPDQWMDRGAPATAERGNSTLEAVEGLNRA